MRFRPFVKKTGRRQNLASWLLLGPDGSSPDQQSEWILGQGWFEDNAFLSVSSYIAAASGTFTRGSDGTYFDKSGLLKVAGSGVLRLDYNPTTGTALGYRAEGQRSNWAGDSEELEEWNDAIMQANVAVAPDGNMTAEKIIEGEGGKTFHRYQAGMSGTYGGSIFAKAGEWPCVTCGMGQSPRVTAQFNLLTGVAIASGSNPIIIKLPNDWYRLTFRGNAGSAGSTGFSMELRNESFTATPLLGPTAGLYAWGHAREDNFVSSYIPSQVGGTARLADNLAYAIAGTAAGSLFIRARTPLGPGTQVLWQWDDGSETNRYRLLRKSDRTIHFIVTVAGADVVDLALSSVLDNTDLKVAVSWQGGAFHASLNGAVAVSSSYAGALPAVTTLREGRSSVGEEWFGTIARMARYSVAYSAAQVQEMSNVL